MEEIANEERESRTRRVLISGAGMQLLGGCLYQDAAHLVKFVDADPQTQPGHDAPLLRGNGKRNLLTTPSGNFTYPEPRRRKKR